MRALLKFDGGEARELQAGPEEKNEAEEVHDILLARIRRIAAIKPDDKDFQNEITKARAVAELAESVIRHDMSVIAMNRLANNMVTDIKLPKFLLR